MKGVVLLMVTFTLYNFMAYFFACQKNIFYVVMCLFNIIYCLYSYFSGSTNHCISLYNTEGKHLNTIKFHEGFMATRISPVSCLSFHPYRVILAAGCVDNTITAYASESRR